MMSAHSTADDKKGKPARAWVDQEDEVAKGSLAKFHVESHKTPVWARAPGATTAEDHDDEEPSTLDATRKGPIKRHRENDAMELGSNHLDSLLSTTTPLLASKHDAQSTAVPKQLSVLSMPRDTAKVVHWHRNGQLAVVGGNRHVYMFHCSGKFVEQLSKVDVQTRVDDVVPTGGGDYVVIVGHETYIPALLTLATEKQVPLRFLDTRNWAVHRNGRRDSGKRDFFITKVVAETHGSSSRNVAVACGSTVTLGSLSTGTVVQSIAIPDPVVDVAFSGQSELMIAARNKVLVYDLRKTAEYVRAVADEGVTDISVMAFSSTMFALGTHSGVVSVYNRSALAGGPATSAPNAGSDRVVKCTALKSMMNLTTRITALSFGDSSNGAVLSFSTKAQKAGLRLARMPECRVVQGFPAVSSSHGFVQTVSISSASAVLSVGENGKVTNYAL